MNKTTQTTHEQQMESLQVEYGDERLKVARMINQAKAAIRVRAAELENMKLILRMVEAGQDTETS